MTHNSNKIPLLSPFVGGKSDYKYWGIHDGDEYEFIAEPFTGGGGITLLHPLAPRTFIGSDADPAVRAAWMTWHDPHLRAIADKRIQFWTEQFKRGSDYEEITAHAHKAWAMLKQEFNSKGNPAVKGRGRIAYFAAVSIVIRRLCFGTVVRTNTKGKLNISLSWRGKNSKLETFQSWRHRWPEPLDAFDFAPHWNFVAMKLKRGDYQGGLVVLDSPYWVPYSPGTSRRGTGAMTAAYPGHKPSSDGLFYDCINSLEAILDTGKAKRVVIFNYISPQLDNAIHAISKRWGYPCWRSNLGPLGSMNNAQQKHGRFDEGVWELGGKRMFKDVPKLEAASTQSSIFDLISA